MSIISARSFSELEFLNEQSSTLSSVIKSRLERKSQLSWFASMPFSWNHLNSFTDAICNFFSTSHLFFFQ